MSKPASTLSTSKLRALLPYVELGCALLAGALWYSQGGAVWYGSDWPGPRAALLLALMWGFYRWRVGFSRPFLSGAIKPIDVLLAFFLLSALVGTQTAYASGPAWAKFWLVVGAWGLYYAVVHQPNLAHLYGVLTVGGLFGVALTIYFFLTNDWSAHPLKVPMLVALGESISALLPRSSVDATNPNIIGGLLAMTLPFYVPLVRLARKESSVPLPVWLRQLLPFLWVGAAGIVLLGLLVTTTRGAWFATLVGFALWGLWRGLGRRFTNAVRLRWIAGLLVLGGALAAIVFYFVLAYDLPGAGALTNRLMLLKNSLPLAWDYVLTGSGLGTFQMNFSIYTLLIHVGYIINSHNVFVDLLVEQGVAGLCLYLSLVLLCIWRGVRTLRCATWQQAWIIEAGLVSLMVILIHGQVEDVLYGSPWLLLFFVPFALVQWAVVSAGAWAVSRPRLEWRWAAGVLGLLLVLAIVFWRPLLAQGYASLGAMRQARVELARYEFGRTPGFIMDAVRQEVDLEEAMALFQRAVTLDSGNATARQRLAGIHLSWGEYDTAMHHIGAVWAAGHRDSVTRLLLGDALVALGRVEEAAAVIAGLTWAQVRMEGQAQDRYWRSNDFARAAYAWRAVALVQPAYAERALQKAQEAEKQAVQQP
ncbi:MAG: O-antigen ligase family protein [Anaerolineae bacterium]|nr:O-antigen ligase family protein [Anaerolineae bacterium]